MGIQMGSRYHGRRVVVKVSGPAKQTFRLFALFCERRKGMKVAEVGR